MAISLLCPIKLEISRKILRNVAKMLLYAAAEHPSLTHIRVGR